MQKYIPFSTAASPKNWVSQAPNGSIPLACLTEHTLENWVAGLSNPHQTWVTAQGFSGKPGESCALPNADGTVALVAFGKPKELSDFWAYARLASNLPTGTYHFENLSAAESFWASHGWATTAYQFNRYKKSADIKANLLLAKEVDKTLLEGMIEATFLTRNLINMPANDFGTTQLESETKALAEANGAAFKSITGEALLKENFPLIYAVGKAGETPPKLLEFTWGNPKHKKVTLVGKGVCFDTGGLDLKPSSAMRNMKKDMGGAAHVLGLAQIIMAQKLPLHLHVIIPTVENNISANAMRPGDIYPSRLGKTVEIGNTDAEGRLILADALTYASEHNPDMLLDFATLTGAARVAVGADIGAFLTNTPAHAVSLMQASQDTHDPLWQLPLHKAYSINLKGSASDLDSAKGGGMAGATTAALFLETFVNAHPWVHFDIMAWNQTSRPGRPQGGEALGLRAVYNFIQTTVANARS